MVATIPTKDEYTRQWAIDKTIEALTKYDEGELDPDEQREREKRDVKRSDAAQAGFSPGTLETVLIGRPIEQRFTPNVFANTIPVDSDFQVPVSSTSSPSGLPWRSSPP